VDSKGTGFKTLQLLVLFVILAIFSGCSKDVSSRTLNVPDSLLKGYFNLKIDKKIEVPYLLNKVAYKSGKVRFWDPVKKAYGELDLEKGDVVTFYSEILDRGLAFDWELILPHKGLKLDGKKAATLELSVSPYERFSFVRSNVWNWYDRVFGKYLNVDLSTKYFAFGRYVVDLTRSKLFEFAEKVKDYNLKGFVLPYFNVIRVERKSPVFFMFSPKKVKLYRIKGLLKEGIPKSACYLWGSGDFIYLVGTTLEDSLGKVNIGEVSELLFYSSVECLYSTVSVVEQSTISTMKKLYKLKVIKVKGHPVLETGEVRLLGGVYAQEGKLRLTKALLLVDGDRILLLDVKTGGKIQKKVTYNNLVYLRRLFNLLIKSREFYITRFGDIYLTFKDKWYVIEKEKIDANTIDKIRVAKLKSFKVNLKRLIALDRKWAIYRGLDTLMAFDIEWKRVSKINIPSDVDYFMRFNDKIFFVSGKMYYSFSSNADVFEFTPWRWEDFLGNVLEFRDDGVYCVASSEFRLIKDRFDYGFSDDKWYLFRLDRQRLRTCIWIAEVEDMYPYLKRWLHYGLYSNIIEFTHKHPLNSRLQLLEAYCYYKIGNLKSAAASLALVNEEKVCNVERSFFKELEKLVVNNK